jgi:hypothetical protein
MWMYMSELLYACMCACVFMCRGVCVCVYAHTGADNQLLHEFDFANIIKCKPSHEKRCL